jgi:hypothetical protein
MCISQPKIITLIDEPVSIYHGISSRWALFPGPTEPVCTHIGANTVFEAVHNLNNAQKDLFAARLPVIKTITVANRDGSCHRMLKKSRRKRA